jgi:hypothetical protein
MSIDRYDDSSREQRYIRQLQIPVNRHAIDSCLPIAQKKTGDFSVSRSFRRFIRADL